MKRKYIKFFLATVAVTAAGVKGHMTGWAKLMSKDVSVWEKGMVWIPLFFLFCWAVYSLAGLLSRSNNVPEWRNSPDKKQGEGGATPVLVMGYSTNWPRSGDVRGSLEYGILGWVRREHWFFQWF